jgi:excisionase family DNA binding protein
MTTRTVVGEEEVAKSSEKLLKVKEASDLLSVHPNTIRVWSEGGLLPAYRIGPRRDRRFRMEDVEAVMRLPIREQSTGRIKMTLCQCEILFLCLKWKGVWCDERA